MKNIIIIQARMGSSRLPGKVLMNLGNTIVLDYVVRRCKQINHIHEVVVATSTLQQDDEIAEWCASNHVSCFRGSEDDVLSRYYHGAKPYEPDNVIRVTADCPFLDVEFANQVVELMERQPVDLVTYKGELPRGLNVEMISFSALQYIYQNGHEPRHREHVTYFAYEFPNLFKSVQLQVPNYLNHPELRITLDTQEDYELCKAVANEFNGDRTVSSKQVIEFLIRHPEIAQLNKHIQQKPVV